MRMRHSKYRNVPTVVGGIRVASKREARRWGELRLLERAGRISGLRRQVPFRLEINGQLVTTYVADFVYCEAGAEIVEDSKGVRTAVYKLKAKLMRAVYGVEIREV
jgi:Protein of unknown function (DUF1064)